MKVIKVKEIIKSPFANTRDKGKLLNRKVVEILKKGDKKICLDLEGIEVLTTSFVDEAFGKLPKNFKNPQLFEFTNLMLPEWKHELMNFLETRPKIWRLNNIKVRGYKNLINFEWKDVKKFNAIFGANASGKTAILEALKLIKLAHIGNPEAFLEEINRYATNPAAIVSTGCDKIEIEVNFTQNGNHEFKGYMSLHWTKDGKWITLGSGTYDKEDKYTFYQQAEEMVSYQGNYNDWMDIWKGIKILKLNIDVLKSPSQRYKKELQEDGQNLPSFLWWLKNSHPEKFKKILYSLQVYVSEVEDIQLQLYELEGIHNVKLLIKDNKGLHPAATVSDGTLRILAYLSFLNLPEQPSIIAIDEPENGFHPGRLAWWIENLVNEAKDDRIQIILATHSPMISESVPREYWWLVQDTGEGAIIKEFPEYAKKVEELI